MTRQRKPSEIMKSIAGGTLVGIGLHILLSNVDRAATRLSHPLGASSGEALGLVPSAVLAASEAARAYAFDHLGLLHGFLRMLVSLWPLLLVISGTILLRDIFADKDKEEESPSRVNFFRNPTNYVQNNRDAGCRFCSPSFDA